MVVVAVRVDHPAHRDVTEDTQIRADLVGLAVGRAGVDQQQTVGAADHAHTDVQRVVATLEHTVGDLVPGVPLEEANQ